MNKKKLSSLQAANLEFVEEPMDDYYTNLLLGIPSRWRVKRILDEIGALENKKILDVGCEAGYVSIEMAKKGAEVLAIDFINEPLQLFKEKLEKFPELKKNIKIRQADARKIPVKSNFFDVIVATEVIEHMPQVLKFAKEAQRVAKKMVKLSSLFLMKTLEKKFILCKFWASILI